jgi:hypothetical protein
VTKSYLVMPEVTIQANVESCSQLQHSFVEAARASVLLNSGLPTHERIGHGVNDIPDTGTIGLVQSDYSYVPRRPHMLLIASVERSKIRQLEAVIAS